MRRGLKLISVLGISKNNKRVGMVSPMRRGLKPIIFLLLANVCQVGMVSPMRRGLKRNLDGLAVVTDARWNGLPDEKGIETLAKGLSQTRLHS